MKHTIYYFTLIILILLSCKKETPNTDTTLEQSTQDDIQKPEKKNIPFVGVWQRQFEVGVGNTHNVNYLIYQDSIRYTLSGPIGNANYVILRDTFILTNNRFIGHTTDNNYYLIFVKNINNDSLTLYKQEITDFSEGMSVDAPSDTTSANHGWNTYFKQ